MNDKFFMLRIYIRFLSRRDYLAIRYMQDIIRYIVCFI